MNDAEKAFALLKAEKEKGMLNSFRANATDKAEVISVIHTVSKRGRGTTGDAVRRVHQYWSFDGELLAEKDVY